MKELAVRPKQAFFPSVGISFLLHVLFFVALVIKINFFKPEPIDFQRAIRVDIVGLPEKVEEITPTQETPPAPEAAKVEEKPIEPKATPVVEHKPEVKLPEKVKEPDTVNLNKIKSKQNSAIEKLKKQSAIDKIKEQVAQDTKTQSQTKPKYSGTVLSPGTELTGVNQLQHEQYISQIDTHVKKYWSLPQWLQNKNLKSQVLVKLDESGNVVYKKIYKSSGNAAYDDEAIQAVGNASPFPRPPEKFTKIVELDGILLGFPE